MTNKPARRSLAILLCGAALWVLPSAYYPAMCQNMQNSNFKNDAHHTAQKKYESGLVIQSTRTVMINEPDSIQSKNAPLLKMGRSYGYEAGLVIEKSHIAPQIKTKASKDNAGQLNAVPVPNNTNNISVPEPNKPVDTQPRLYEAGLQIEAPPQSDKHAKALNVQPKQILDIPSDTLASSSNATLNTNSDDVSFDIKETKIAAIKPSELDKRTDKTGLIPPPALPPLANIPQDTSRATSTVKSSSSPMSTSRGWQSDFIRNLAGNDGVLILTSASHSSDSAIQQDMTLDDAVSLALENSNELKAALAETRSRYWEKIGVYSQYLPSANLDIAAGKEHSRPASYNDSSGDRVLDNKHGRRDRNLLVRQPLMDLSIIFDMFQANNKEELATYDKIDKKNNVAGSTVASYMKMSQAQVSISLANDYLDYLNNLIKVMEARVAAGGATSADLDRIVSRAANAESAKMEASAELQTSLEEFKRLTGTVPLKLHIPKMLAPEIPNDIENAKTAAIRNNPKYKSELKKIDMAKNDRNKYYSSYAPRVYAQLNNVYSYNAGGAANANPIDGVYETSRTDSAMIVAQWSINGLTSATGIMSSTEKEKQSYFESRDSLDRIMQAIGVNYTAIDSTRNRLEILQKTVEANERVASGFEEQYKNGTRSLFDLLDAHEQLYNSRLNLSRVIFAHTQASYQIHQQMGDIIDAVLKNTQVQ